MHRAVQQSSHCSDPSQASLDFGEGLVKTAPTINYCHILVIITPYQCQDKKLEAVHSHEKMKTWKRELY